MVSMLLAGPAKASPVASPPGGHAERVAYPPIGGRSIPYGCGLCIATRRLAAHSAALAALAALLDWSMAASH